MRLFSTCPKLSKLSKYQINLKMQYVSDFSDNSKRIYNARLKWVQYIGWV